MAEDKKAKAKGGQNFNTQSVSMYGKNYSWKDLPETQKANCGVYGLALKLTRSTAGMNKDTHTDAERSAQVDRTYEHLKANQWNVVGVSRDTVRVDKSKVAEIQEKGNATELAVLKKLGLA